MPSIKAYKLINYEIDGIHMQLELEGKGEDSKIPTTMNLNRNKIDTTLLASLSETKEVLVRGFLGDGDDFLTMDAINGIYVKVGKDRYDRFYPRR